MLKRHLKPADWILALAIAVVTGAWLWVAALSDFYYRNPSPGFDGEQIVFLSARTIRSDRPASIQPVTARKLIQADLGLEAKTAFKATGFFAKAQGSLPEPVYGVMGTRDFFRVFAPAQNVPQFPRGGTTLIISRSLASRLFSNPSEALGNTLWLEGESYAVSLVIDDISWPSGLLSSPESAGFFLLSDDRLPEPSIIAGRLGRGVGTPEVEQRLDQILRQPDAWPEGVDSSRLRGSVQSLDERVRLNHSWAPGLLAGCFILLTLALGTAAQLILQQAHEQSREWTLHSILGATRRQVTFLYLKRLLPKLIAGAGLGALVAATAVKRFTSESAFSLLADANLMASPLMITLQLGLCLALSAALAALAPFAWVGRAERQASLNQSCHPGLWARRALTVFTALQLALLTAIVASGYGVLTLYSEKLENAAGFRQENLFFVRIYAPPGYDAEGQVRLLPALVRSVRANPQVKALALSHLFLPLLSDGTSGMVVEARGIGTPMTFSVRKVSPEFFEVLGLQQPRQPLDESLPNQVVISESLRDALGIRKDEYPASFRMGLSAVTAVGDIADITDFSLTGPSGPALYYPLVLSELKKWPFLLVRSEGGLTPSMLRSLVEGELLRLQIHAFVAPVLSAQDAVEGRLALTRFFYSMFLALGAVVSFVSLCSVVAAVQRETAGRIHEVAVRQALGATSRSVGALLLRRIVAGAFLGILGGMLLGTKVSAALVVALGSISHREDSLAAFALVLTVAVATSIVSFVSFSRVELAELLRKE